MNDSRRPPTLKDPSPDRFGFLTLVASLIMVLFLSIPLLALTSRALSMGASPLQHLDIQSLSTAIGISLGTTAISGMIILLLGTPLALLLARQQFRLKGLISLLVELPIVMPPVVAGLALLLTFGRRGLIGAPLAGLGINLAFTPIAVIMAQVFVASPFYIRAAQIQFQSIPRELEEAARIDGATGFRSLREVILPLSWRSLLAGFILSWARALGEFGATILFAGNLQGSTQTMPLLVYAALEQNIDSALATGMILIALAAISMGLVQLLTSRAAPEGEEVQPPGLAGPN